MSNLKHAIFDPVIPYNSLYIDIPFLDVLKAASTPKLLSTLTPFVPQPYDPSISCYGCRVRQIHGLPIDPNVKEYETCNDIHQRLQKLSYSPSTMKNETSTSIHYDLAALWALPYINNKSELIMSSPQTLSIVQTNPLCSSCSACVSTPTLSTTTTPSSSTSLTSPTTIIPTLTIPKYIPPPHSYNVLTMLSVRSALSSWLSYKNFAPGNIVIFSAINIPDMSRVIRAHNLIPLPVDLDTNTTTIDLELLEKTIQHYGVYETNSTITTSQQQPITTQPKICAVIVSYIFGIRNDITDTINLVHKYKLPFIEDCAEAYTDINFSGHPDSDLTLFSFGSIKNCTSFGGGIARIKSFDDYYGMLQIQSNWPRVTNQKYYDKIKKMTPIWIALNYPFVSNSVIRTFKAAGKDVKELVVANLRGFPGDMINGIRHQPCISMVYVLRHRIAQATNHSLTLASQKGLQFESLISKYNINIDTVGYYAAKRGYWLYPFVVVDADSVTDQLSARGVQVYRGATQLQCLQVPDELLNQPLSSSSTTDNDITNNNTITIPAQIQWANQLMEHVIYLPLSKAIPYHVMDSIAQHLQAICGMREKIGERIGIIEYPPVSNQVKKQAAVSQIANLITTARL